MANSHNLYSSSLGCWDLSNLGVLNADKSYYTMENLNAPSFILPNVDNYVDEYDYGNPLSTGYLEDALLEFSLRFKRRRLMFNSHDHDHHHLHHHFVSHITDDLSYWSNWNSNYSMQLEELSSASLLTDHDMHYSSLGEIMGDPVKEISEEVINFAETKVEEEIISCNTPKLIEVSPCSGLAYTSDSYSTESSSISDDQKEKRKMKKVTEKSGTTKMVYPFGLVKPGAVEGDITLNDINRRILMPPTRPLKHPVGEFAGRPGVSAHGPGLSGKAVVALTKIHTQGRGTITIIRTKG